MEYCDETHGCEHVKGESTLLLGGRMKGKAMGKEEKGCEQECQRKAPRGAPKESSLLPACVAIFSVKFS